MCSSVVPSTLLLMVIKFPKILSYLRLASEFCADEVHGIVEDLQEVWSFILIIIQLLYIILYCNYKYTWYYACDVTLSNIRSIIFTWVHNTNTETWYFHKPKHKLIYFYYHNCICSSKENLHRVGACVTKLVISPWWLRNLERDLLRLNTISINATPKRFKRFTLLCSSFNTATSWRSNRSQWTCSNVTACKWHVLSYNSDKKMFASTFWASSQKELYLMIGCNDIFSICVKHSIEWSI